MGSYLTVVNDTKDTWDCKVGPDMKALKIGTIIIGATAAILGTIATLGFAAPAAAGMVAAGTATFVGIPTAALVAVTAPFAGAAMAAGVTGGVSAFAVAVTKVLGTILNGKGFHTILPNDRRRWGKMTLSLWQQSECKKTTLDGAFITVETLFMRPIFSGSTNKSNRDHNIAWWLDKHGTSKERIEGSPDYNPGVTSPATKAPMADI